MEILDTLGDIELHLDAIRLLTDQIVALSGKTDEKSIDEINALDTARIATQKRTEELVSGLSHYLEYGLKVGSQKELQAAFSA